MKIKLLVLTIFFLYVESSADLLRLVSFNPGLKIGYEFGSRHGFLIGFESSLTYSSPYSYLSRPWGGIVGGIQFNVHDKHFLPYWEKGTLSREWLLVENGISNIFQDIEYLVA